MDASRTEDLSYSWKPLIGSQCFILIISVTRVLGFGGALPPPSAPGGVQCSVIKLQSRLYSSLAM